VASQKVDVLLKFALHPTDDPEDPEAHVTFMKPVTDLSIDGISEPEN
jgi:hypothetical protein